MLHISKIFLEFQIDFYFSSFFYYNNINYYFSFVDFFPRFAYFFHFLIIFIILIIFAILFFKLIYFHNILSFFNCKVHQKTKLQRFLKKILTDPLHNFLVSISLLLPHYLIYRFMLLPTLLLFFSLI